MAEQWAFYTRTVDDAMASVFVDLSIRDHAPDASRPILLSVWVRSPHPMADADTGNGSTQLEIEEALTAALSSRLDARLIGRVHTVGRREHYYYAARADAFVDVVTDVMARFPGYRTDLDEKQDPSWSQYLQLLYPSPDVQRRVRNRIRLEEMRKLGDALDTIRPIEHYASFPTRFDRDAFVSSAIAQSFLVSPAGLTDNAPGDLPFTTVVQRIDLPDEETIEQLHMILSSLAERNHGEYAGWQAELIRPTTHPGLVEKLVGMIEDKLAPRRHRDFGLA